MPRSPSSEHLVKRCRCAVAEWPSCAHPWHLRYAFAGQEWRLSLHKEADWPASKPMPLKDAIPIRNRVIAEIEAGKRNARPLDITFGDVCAEYQRRYVNIATRRPAARQGFEYAVARLRRASVPVAHGRRAALETLPIRAITRAHIEAIREVHRAKAQAKAEAWQAAQADPKRKAKVRRPPAKNGEVSLNRLFSRLRHLFNWAVLEGYVEVTPFKRGGVTAIALNHAAETPRDRRLADEDEGRLLDAAGPHLHALIVAILETGMRPGEALNLRWCDVEIEAGVLALRGERTKTSRPRAIPVTQRLRAVLEMREAALRAQFTKDAEDGTSAEAITERMAPCYVFGDEIGRKVASVKTAWHTAIGKAGLDGLHLHDLRREFASRLLEAKVELHLVRDWCGHSNITTTSRYLATTISGLQAAAKRFEAASRTNSRTPAEVPVESLPDEPALTDSVTVN